LCKTDALGGRQAEADCVTAVETRSARNSGTSSPSVRVPRKTEVRAKSARHACCSNAPREMESPAAAEAVRFVCSRVQPAHKPFLRATVGPALRYDLRANS
jgi:hypothetical protein